MKITTLKVSRIQQVSVFLLILALIFSSSNQSFAYDAQFYSSNDILYSDPDSFECISDNDLSQGGGVVTGNVKSFVDTFMQSAYETSIETGIPWEIIMGQAALESAWGKSTLTTKYYNFFGIKAPPGKATPPLPTKECSNGSCNLTTATFRWYASASESFQDHARLMLSSARYRPALQYQKDPSRYIEAIWRAGYATDPEYPSKVMSAVRSIINSLGDDYGSKYKPSSEIDFPSDNVDTVASLSARQDICSESSKSAVTDGIAWIIDRKWYDNPSTRYGVMKGHQANSGFYYHYGDSKRYAIDISPPGILGAPQYALAGGRVVRVNLPSSRAGGNGGLEIESKLPNGKTLLHLYAHSQKVSVRVGDVVKAGQQVAEVGNIGNSSVPHIHLEIKYDRRPICGNDIFIELANNQPIDFEKLASKASPNCLGRV